MKHRTGLRARLRMAAELYCENRYFTRMQGGLGYEVYCLRQQVEFEELYGLPGIRPNRLGCWLLVLGQEVRYHLLIAKYVVDGRQFWLDWDGM